MRQEIGKIKFLAEKRIFSENVWLDVLFYRIFMGRRIDSMQTGRFCELKPCFYLLLSG